MRLKAVFIIFLISYLVFNIIGNRFWFITNSIGENVHQVHSVHFEAMPDVLSIKEMEEMSTRTSAQLDRKIRKMIEERSSKGRFLNGALLLSMFLYLYTAILLPKRFKYIALYSSISMAIVAFELYVESNYLVISILVITPVILFYNYLRRLRML
ncbi:hypothetical protein [Flocculibacter collagenilyticus]|uniref:hypothetical protein n=1 Tax=Flocculibacter collagenilyticus TaxID=2744479 RepID=UPI0018F77E3E|nr:hypothetical protein [Flocculibacter collagenilyticus]